MPRLTNDKHQSLNESISHVANPAAALARAEEYAELLEDVITALCEEMEIDPQELVEDIQTPERAAEMEKKGKKEETTRLAKLKATHWADDRGRDKINRDYSKVANRDWKEKQDPDRLYGKGGRVVGRYKPGTSGAAGFKHQKRYEQEGKRSERSRRREVKVAQAKAYVAKHGKRNRG
jgi:hypothetical protein